MDTKEIVITSVIPEHVKYWTWVNNFTLGIVGSKNVFHISIKNITSTNTNVEATRIFAREKTLSGESAPV